MPMVLICLGIYVLNTINVAKYYILCDMCLQTQGLAMFGEVDDYNSIKTFHEVGARLH
jgi:hypothetical protein